MSQKTKFKYPQTESDEKDVVDRIDLSSLKPLTTDDTLLNKAAEVPKPVTGEYSPSGQPVEFVYLESAGVLVPRWVVETDNSKPNYKNLAGQKVTPTQVLSLLTQNINGQKRPASTFFWQDQTDEGYYRRAYISGTAQWLAASQPNYYVVDGTSPHRLKFKCPNAPRGTRPTKDDLCDTAVPWIVRTEMPTELDDLSIYIDPDNNRARWACPRCTYTSTQDHISIEEAKVLGVRLSVGRTFAIFHEIPRALRQELADDGIIPGKEYKYKDRVAEIPRLLRYVRDNPGPSFYEIDQALGWAHGTAERLLHNLKDKVVIRKGRKGQKGYRVYINH